MAFRSPLAYLGVSPQTPPLMLINRRAPTQNDFGFPLGTQWVALDEIDPTASTQYVLVSVAQNIAVWNALGGGVGSTYPDHALLVGTGTATINSIAASSTVGLPLLSAGSSADPDYGVAPVVGGGTGQNSLTANALLMGDGTNPVAFINPVATEGMPLVSTGSSTAPEYGIASVSGGGTGVDVFTPYSVICGGISGDAPLQNVAGLGNAGEVLTSQGAGALPQWAPATGGGGSGAALSIQIFTSSGTYTPSVDMTTCMVEIVGGGAGGQSVDTTSSNPIGGNGGGAGAYAKRLFTAAQIGASQSVVIGTGGAADANGVDSTFGAFITAGGGFAAVDAVNPGLGGAATGGTINITGGAGGISSQSASGIVFGGFGGSSYLGNGATAYGDDDLAGAAGLNYGGGGAGAVASSAAQTLAGGAGAGGICIITEYGDGSTGSLDTITGNTGGAVPGSGGNINLVGSGGLVVTGNPMTNTLTISGTPTPMTINQYYIGGPASGTYTPSAGMTQVHVVCVGGGGGSGGARKPTTSARSVTTAGGGAGGITIGLYSAATIGASKTYSIGAGGTAGTGSSASNGGNGGSTTFGGFMTATGGQGSAGSTAGTVGAGNAYGAAGGSGSGSLLLAAFTGANGENCYSSAVGGGNDGLGSWGGQGASSPYGGGGAGNILTSAGAGANGTGYGAGAGGAKANSGSTLQTANGGQGAGGLLIITEYIAS